MLDLLFTPEQLVKIYRRTIQVGKTYRYVEEHALTVYTQPGLGCEVVPLPKGLIFTDKITILDKSGYFYKIKCRKMTYKTPGRELWMHGVDLYNRPKNHALLYSLLLLIPCTFYNLFTGYYFTKSN